MIFVEYEGKVYPAYSGEKFYSFDDGGFGYKYVLKTECREITEQEYHAQCLLETVEDDVFDNAALVGCLVRLIEKSKPRPKATLKIPKDAWVECDKNNPPRPEKKTAMVIRWENNDLPTVEHVSEEMHPMWCFVTHYCEIQIEEE